MSSFRDPFRLEGVTAAFATKKALQVKLPDGQCMWVPKSVIHDDSEVWKLDQTGTLIVQGWWAEREGLTEPF